DHYPVAAGPDPRPVQLDAFALGASAAHHGDRPDRAHGPLLSGPCAVTRGYHRGHSHGLPAPAHHRAAGVSVLQRIGGQVSGAGRRAGIVRQLAEPAAPAQRLLILTSPAMASPPDLAHTADADARRPG